MSRILILVALLVTLSFPVCSQTTEFTYQGSLNIGSPPGTPAQTPHDFEFRLYDAPTGGTQQGSPVSKSNVLVTNGVFAVTLDFGNLFPGASRFLGISVRPTGDGDVRYICRPIAANQRRYTK